MREVAYANKTKGLVPETAIGPRILLIDFELFANVARTWGFYEQNVIKIVRPRMVCSVAWKWLGDKKGYVKALPDFPGYARNRFDNFHLMKFVRDLYNQAQVVVGHNFARFDKGRSNTDITRNQIEAPAPYKIIDTLRIARAEFGFNQNSLDALCEFLGGPRKVKHRGFEMWEACENGDPQAWKEMRAYNLGDVDPCLEFVYHRLVPWYRPRWLQRIAEGKKP